MNIIKGSLAATGVAALGFGIAFAASPHFINAADSINFDNGNLTCSWKEAGLGNNQNVTYSCSATADAVYVCVNRGNANPSASNKTDVSDDVSAEGTFNSGKNGQITASLVVNPPDAGTFSCPPGQSLELARVSYTNVLLTDTTNGISIALADQATGCLLPNVRGAC